MSAESVKRVLKKFGLTEKESEIYVFLARNGMHKGGEIANILKMHKGQVYRILKSLQSRGLVEMTLEVPTHFTAVSFARVLDSNIRMMREEATSLQNERKELIGNWIKTHDPIVKTPKEKLMMIEGRRNIYSKVFQMMKEAEEEVLIMICRLNWFQAFQSEIDWAMFEKVNKNSIQLRILMQNSGINDNILQQRLTRISEKHLGNNIYLRQLETKLDLQTHFFIKDKDQALFFLKDNILSTANQEETCLWTNSNAMIHMMSILFNELWHTSIKISLKNN